MTESITNVKTLTRFLLTHISEEELRNDLAILFTQISLATKVTANAIRRAAIEHLLGEAGVVNVQGEDVKKLDLVANDAFRNAMVQSELIAAIASEEDDEIILVQNGHGKYTISYDPLDGSSNIDANVSIGSIFGIHRKLTPGSNVQKSDILQPGSKQIAAGYSLYGTSIMLVISLGEGVNGFTLDNSLGEFVLTHPNIKMKPTAPIYSINEGNSIYWDSPTKQFVEYLKTTSKDKKSPYSLRYVGSMVADVHRTLLYGGIFMYPSDSKSPNGKLRYLYEVSPLSFIMEQAGGASVIGAQRALDVIPTNIHMRVPCFMGSKEEVTRIQQLYASSTASL